MALWTAFLLGLGACSASQELSRLKPVPESLRSARSAISARFLSEGVTALVVLNGETKRVTVGTLDLLKEAHQVPASLIGSGARDTLTYVGWEGRVQAVISLDDVARPEAAGMIEALKATGVLPAVISGNRKGPTRRLADDLGMDDVRFECSPARKVQALQNGQLGTSSLTAHRSSPWWATASTTRPRLQRPT